MGVSDMALRWIILCSAEAGLRSGTSMRLRRMDIADDRLRVVTKNGQIADIPVSPRLAAMLAVLPYGTDPASPTPVVQLFDGGLSPPSLNAMQIRWQTMKARLHIRPALRFHDLRRGLAHRMYAATGDLRDVQALLAHKTLASTLHYLEAAKKQVSADTLNRALAERPKK